MATAELPLRRVKFNWGGALLKKISERFQCLVFLLLLPLCSCEKYYLSVKRESVNASTLASTFVGSPDPRQKKPPTGEELIIGWNLPRNLLEQGLLLQLDIIYHDHSKKRECYPITQQWGSVTHSLLGEEYLETGGFLTYKAEIITPNGTVLKEWKQQLWFDLITLGE